MKTKINRFKTLAILGSCLTVWNAPALADDQALREEIRMLKERLSQLEQRLEASEQQSEARKEQRSVTSNLMNGITISGAIEVEAARTEDYDGVESSDTVLATVELGIDAQITDWVNAHILLLHEEDGPDLEVDEGIITLGNPEASPLFLAAGRMYVPFGGFESGMISDPLTLEIGETRESTIQIGYEGEGLYGSLYTFNGDTQNGSKDKIDQYGANIGFGRETDAMSYDFGLGYINNIGDSDTLGEHIGGGAVLNDYVGGFNVRGLLSTGPFTLIAEYVAATDSFTPSEVDFNGAGAEPVAWHLEVDYDFTLAGNDATVAISYNETDEALALELPKQRYGIALAVGIFENTTWSLEWLHDKDYDMSDGGSDNNADTFTTQLAVEF